MTQERKNWTSRPQSKWTWAPNQWPGNRENWFCPGFTLRFRHQAPRALDMSSILITREWRKCPLWAGFVPGSPCGFDTRPPESLTWAILFTLWFVTRSPEHLTWAHSKPMAREWDNEQSELVFSPLSLVVSTPDPQSTWHGLQANDTGIGDMYIVSWFCPGFTLRFRTPGPESTWHELPTNDPGTQKIYIVSWFCPRFTLRFRHHAPGAHDMRSRPMTRAYKPMTQGWGRKCTLCFRSRSLCGFDTRP